MRITRADLEFARQTSFARAFPTLESKFEEQQKRLKFLALPMDRPRVIHDVVNGHALGMTPYNWLTRPKTKQRYVWNNTLSIIRQRLKRGEDWRGYQHWGNGAGSDMHLTIMGRISRRLRKAERRTV